VDMLHIITADITYNLWTCYILSLEILRIICGYVTYNNCRYYVQSVDMLHIITGDITYNLWICYI